MGLERGVLCVYSPVSCCIAQKREFQLTFSFSNENTMPLIYIEDLFIATMGHYWLNYASKRAPSIVAFKYINLSSNTFICLPFDEGKQITIRPSTSLLCLSVSTLRFFSVLHSDSSRNHLPTRQKMRHRVKAEVGHVICGGSWEL